MVSAAWYGLAVEGITVASEPQLPSNQPVREQERTYFDWSQSDAPGQPVAQPGLTTLQQVFGYDPSPDRADGANILGTQGQLWTEFLPTPQRVDDMAYPRMCALAERAWSAMDTDYADFADRLAAHALRLTAAGVTYRENSA